MAKTPKLAGTETKAGKLRELQKLGLTDAKTFSKGAAKVWSDYKTIFPKGVPATTTFIKASAEARKACASVNMRVLGNAVVFPTRPGGDVKIRETKHGVFVEYGVKGRALDKIVLSKNGDHLKYGMKLARQARARQDPDNVSLVFGTLKTSNYKIGGVQVNSFQRDVARLTQDPLDAVLDDRYAVEKLEVDGETVRIDNAFIDRLAETNGTTALIFVRW
jgi:hypothetical protein